MVRLIDTEVDNHYQEELEKAKHNEEIKQAKLMQEDIEKN